MKATIKNVEGLTFVAKSKSNHWVTFDGPEDFGGHNAASRPMEMLLMSYGSCTGSDVKSIVTKRTIANHSALTTITSAPVILFSPPYIPQSYHL